MISARFDSLARKSTWTVVFVLCSLWSGCKSCEKDKPYVPYTIDPHAALGSGPAAPAAPSVPYDAAKPSSPFSPVFARRVDSASTNSLGGHVTAPDSGVIQWLLESDVTGDDAPDPIAWVRTKDATSGQLVQFVRSRADGPLTPRTLLALPTDFTLSTECQSEVDLKQVGPKTIAVSFVKICPNDKHPSSSPEVVQPEVTQWMAAVVPMRNPALRLSLVVQQPSTHDRLEFALDGSDRDGDAFDDLTMNLQLSSPPAYFNEGTIENPAVILRFFDRSAGLSRDPDEPAASFNTIVKKLTRVAKGKQRSVVAVQARSVRRLFHLLCAESSSAKVRIGPSAVSCGTDSVLSNLSLAEIEAAIRDTTVLGKITAVGAYERLVRQKTTGKALEKAQKLIEDAIPPRNMDSYYLPFFPTVVASSVAWGPLAFHQDGSLLIRTDSSVMRFDPKQRVALPDPATGPIPPWDLRVATPDAMVAFAGFQDNCRGGLLVGKLQKGDKQLNVLLPADPIDARGCAKSTPYLVDASALAFFEAGLSIIAGGVPLWMTSDGTKAVRQSPMPGPAPYGSARSPDGNWFVKATPLGVLLVGSDGAASLVRTTSMKIDYNALLGCTVANGARAIACRRDTTTTVFVTP